MTSAGELVAGIRELHRQRQALLRAWRSLTLQIKAMCRRLAGGDKAEGRKLYRAMMGIRRTGHPLADQARLICLPFLAARDTIAQAKKETEKHLEAAARELPVAELVERTPGLGYGGLAALVGEVGDFSAYDKGIAGIWKRCGLGLVDGVRQRKVANPDLALRHGYSAERRAVVFAVTDSLLRRQSTIEGPYRALYDARKRYEEARNAERPEAERLNKAHVHARATRYVGKRLLRHIYSVWLGMPIDQLSFALGDADAPQPAKANTDPSERPPAAPLSKTLGTSDLRPADLPADPISCSPADPSLGAEPRPARQSPIPTPGAPAALLSRARA